MGWGSNLISLKIVFFFFGFSDVTWISYFNLNIIKNDRIKKIEKI
jgi:hypothetical protein